MAGGGTRRWLIAVVLTVVLLLASASRALAEVRSATIDDGADPGAQFDVRQVQATFNREARSLEVTFRLHNPLPSERSSSGLAYMVAWVTSRPYAESADGCDIDEEEAAGDTYVNIEQSYDGTYQATTNVEFRREYNRVTPAISPDRREISVTIVDDLYANSNPRCLRADSQGQGTYDPSQPDGGPQGDSLANVFFDGFGPPGTRWAPKPECSDGIDNDQDGAVDLGDPHCDGDAKHSSEARYPRSPTLTSTDARYYARTALRRKFGAAYKHGSGRRVACRRVGRLRQRCKVSWFAGDVSWRGTVGIWYARTVDGLTWNYNMRITRRAESCGTNGCRTRTRVIRVR